MPLTKHWHMTGEYFHLKGRLVKRHWRPPARTTNVLCWRRGSQMLEYALHKSSLQVHMLPAADGAHMSRISNSATRRALGGGLGSRALIAFRRHLHCILDLGRWKADAVGGAVAGLTPRVTLWMELKMLCKCVELLLCICKRRCAVQTPCR